MTATIAPITVDTERLRLIALPPRLMQMLCEQGHEAVARELGVAHGDVLLPEEFRAEFAAMLPDLVKKVTDAGDDWPWCTQFDIVLKAENRAIGGCGLNGLANDRGEVFCGYWIDERHRNRGYMTEALAALVQWAFADPHVQAITANAPADNIPSHRTLLKNGFIQRGEFEGHPFFVRSR